MSEKLYRLLELAKNTRDNFNLSKEELFIEYGKLVDEYETILKKFEQISLPPGTFSPGEKVEIEISAFSGLSHQFRTPLIFILTALEQMHTDSNNDEEKKKLFMMMIHAQRLFYIFKRVMALSDQGKEELQLNTGLYDIISFLKGIMASFFLLAQENKIELTLNTKENDISLYFDYEKMSEAISNILMSALRYTPAGGQIKISVQKLSPDILLIVVKDSGPGIPQAQLDAIFDRYYSLDKPLDYQKKGFGIGLYMVKEYIRMHAGTFHINSLEGEGVEITIKIPIKKKEFKHSESEKTARPASSEISINKIASRHAFMLRLEKEEMRRPKADPINIEHSYHERDIILIVEDNKDMCEFISTLLKEYYTVVEAENGRKGIDLAKKI
ncbi:MAG: ATP-binding protein, partial [Acidobacteria bacterium]|nr:ATP-binding protein [Acidobacteriota bacterium]